MTYDGFWRSYAAENRRAVLGDFGVINNVWYIFPQGGAPSLGAPAVNCFSTFSDLKANLKSRDVIILGGVLREQAVCPLGVYDVTVLGAANFPRQATSSGVPTGGGATWMPPSSSPAAATALIEVIQQGWMFQNIFFNPHTSSPAIQGTRAEDSVHPDPSHLVIDGCRFGGGGSGQIGFQDSGGCSDIIIKNCEFYSLTTAIKGITGAGIADPLTHAYLNNYFHQNTNDIVIGCSYGRIQNNTFKNTTTQKVDLTAGGHEIVTLNFFDDGNADIDPAHGYTGSATGTWLNYVKDQAALVFGQPA